MNIFADRNCALIICIIFITLYSQLVKSMDIVRLETPQSGFDKKTAHKEAVIKHALELTTSEYGPYRIEKLNLPIVQGRALKMIQEGNLLNLYISIANDEWNKKTTPIKVPIRFGINSYRLLLVNRKDLSKFSDINTIEDLKKLRVGLGRDWSITKVFRAKGFQTVESSSFEGTFLMLPYQRFDYIPRGINEIFEELQLREDSLKDIVVEPTLALEIKLATYVYVSSKYPRLAKRMEVGLQMMLNNGDLHKLFNDYYSEDIKKANIQNRKLIRIDNPLFVDKELLDDPKYRLPPHQLTSN